jgi:hypothetical protein
MEEEDSAVGHIPSHSYPKRPSETTSSLTVAAVPSRPISYSPSSKTGWIAAVSVTDEH